ncbi:unnamed protein product [Phytophthora lilii]|uniref:Unnamed protein product n=1 Tax=Phytophthora lilii TaxID=2077276 RepID=A0A9W7D8F1_9STRA|nr:unnamed protein product [Phytophthora lilii]
MLASLLTMTVIAATPTQVWSAFPFDSSASQQSGGAATSGLNEAQQFRDRFTCKCFAFPFSKKTNLALITASPWDPTPPSSTIASSNTNDTSSLDPGSGDIVTNSNGFDGDASRADESGIVTNSSSFDDDAPREGGSGSKTPVSGSNNNTQNYSSSSSNVVGSDSGSNLLNNDDTSASLSSDAGSGAVSLRLIALYMSSSLVMVVISVVAVI